MSRTKSTLEQLASLPQVFDRLTRDGLGGRVGFFERMPAGYDNKAGLPWGEVRGRYFYPWRETGKTETAGIDYCQSCGGSGCGCPDCEEGLV